MMRGLLFFVSLWFAFSCCKSDIAARLGGEAYGILLARMGEAAGEILIEPLFFGCAIAHPGQPLREAMPLADRRMYEA